jgi:hypothetical protein
MNQFNFAQTEDMGVAYFGFQLVAQAAIELRQFPCKHQGQPSCCMYGHFNSVSKLCLFYISIYIRASCAFEWSLFWPSLCFSCFLASLTSVIAATQWSTWWATKIVIGALDNSSRRGNDSVLFQTVTDDPLGVWILLVVEAEEDSIPKPSFQRPGPGWNSSKIQFF